MPPLPGSAPCTRSSSARSAPKELRRPASDDARPPPIVVTASGGIQPNRAGSSTSPAVEHRPRHWPEHRTLPSWLKASGRLSSLLQVAGHAGWRARDISTVKPPPLPNRPVA